MAEVNLFNRSLFSLSLPLNCISPLFIYFFISYSMTGKLGGHAGPVMTVLLKEANKESLVFTGSRDHYVKVREFMDPHNKLQKYTRYHFGGIALLGSIENVLF